MGQLPKGEALRMYGYGTQDREVRNITLSRVLNLMSAITKRASINALQVNKHVKQIE